MHGKIRTAAVNFTEIEVLQMGDVSLSSLDIFQIDTTATGDEISIEHKKSFFL